MDSVSDAGIELFQVKKWRNKSLIKEHIMFQIHTRSQIVSIRNHLYTLEKSALLT